MSMILKKLSAKDTKEHTSKSTTVSSTTSNQNTFVQSVMNAMDRDAISGWGAVVHIIEKDKVIIVAAIA